MASNNRHQNTRGISETEAQQLAKLALGDLEEVPVQTCLGPSNAMLVKINDDYLYHDMVVICADDGGDDDDDDDDDDDGFGGGDDDDDDDDDGGVMVMMAVVVVQKIVQAWVENESDRTGCGSEGGSTLAL